MIDCANVYISNSTVCEGIGCFAKIEFQKDDIIEIGIATIMTNCDGNENPHLFTWSNDMPNNTWAITSGCAPYYNCTKDPNIRMIRDFKKNTFSFIALQNINKDDELFHTYKSINWRKCFSNIKNL
tara:strand:+ start:145 stop:522 length:378 start_codon:yes stop_codon:yes gene_type:complete